MTYATGTEGFSAVETKPEGLAVSYDLGTNSFEYDYGTYYINGSNVYVYGTTDSRITLFNGGYGAAVNIDATGSSGEARLAGDLNSNVISGGSYRNLLWGGWGFANDILVGGTGFNFFVSGQSEGSDTILNAGMYDTVYLRDVTVSDIIATASDGNTVGILFNTGNVLTVTGTNAVSADFVLADDSRYWYDYSFQTWHQSS